MANCSRFRFERANSSVDFRKALFGPLAIGDVGHGDNRAQRLPVEIEHLGDAQ